LGDLNEPAVNAGKIYRKYATPPSIAGQIALHLQILINSLKSAFMNQETLSQLEQLVDKLIQRNSELQQEVTTLRENNTKLMDENETLQLEVLESEEKQKETSSTLTSLLEKLQSASAAG
tara:strand:+ start:546 stop:905 length:360 start_codon:yes stop_codon:yes gene_type:complete